MYRTKYVPPFVSKIFFILKGWQCLNKCTSPLVKSYYCNHLLDNNAIYNPAYTYKFQLKTTIVLPGDHISIFPENDPELVNEVMKRLSEVPKENEIVVWNGNYNKH